jgi:hypothetical protein
MTRKVDYMRAWRAAKAAAGKCHGCFNRGAGERVGKFRGTLTLCGLCAEERRVYGREHYTPVPGRVLKKTAAAALAKAHRRGQIAKPLAPSREERTAMRIEKLMAAAGRVGKLEGAAGH